MRHVWLSGVKRLEILKPQVDDGGYDLVLKGNDVLRHVQLKSTLRSAKVGRFTINASLAKKPSGCVVVLLFDDDTMDLGPFLWFGGRPGERLPSLNPYKVAKHAKADSQGIKHERPNMRTVPRAEFTPVSSIPELATRLFGQLGTPTPAATDAR